MKLRNRTITAYQTEMRPEARQWPLYVLTLPIGAHGDLRSKELNYF
jgi:hypothetical protein